MADRLNLPPPGVQYERSSSIQTLNKNPEDKPNWGAAQGETQTRSASMTALSTGNPQPVAAHGAHPGQGETQVRTSSVCDLSRTATSPYDAHSKTDPLTDL